MVTKFPIVPVFGGRRVLPTTLKNYPIILRRLMKNIRNIPYNISHELANIHDKKTLQILKGAKLRPEAKTALVAHLDLIDKDATNLKIICMSDVGAFFEYGVASKKTGGPYFVSRKLEKIHGGSVGKWMDAHGFSKKAGGFIVGAPGTILAKPGVRFMEQGFNESDKRSPTVTDKFIRKI